MGKNGLVFKRDVSLSYLSYVTEIPMPLMHSSLTIRQFMPKARFVKFCAAVMLAAMPFIAAPISASAAPFLVVDTSNGSVLAANEPNQRWHPASLTKLMTSYAAFRMIASGEVTLKSPVRISKTASRLPPSKMGYRENAIMTLEDALKMVIVKSANDVAYAVGESLAGSEAAFVAKMNAEAASIGMRDSQFKNPHGLHDSEQFTTARDMAVLASTIRSEFPQYRSWFAYDGIISGDRTIASFNGLLGRFEGADGMKTGYVCSSGFNQIGSATRQGRTLIGVVLGEVSVKDRTEKLAELLTKGFETQPTSVALMQIESSGFSAPPIDQRPRICGPKPESAQSEDGDAAADAPSPYLTEKKGVLNAVRVALGGADGPPAPMAAIFIAMGGVPIPTPRPEYVPDTIPLSAGFLTSETGTVDALRGTIPVPLPRPDGPVETTIN